MTVDQLLSAWASYVTELASSADESTRAEDRQQYTRHLAAAALVGAKLVAREHAAAQVIVEEERRAYGWSYLPSEAGERAERAFATFAKHLFS